MDRCSIVALVLLAASCGKTDDARQRAEVEAQAAQLAEHKARLDRLARDLQQEGVAIADAQEQLARATTDAEREAARAKLKAAEARQRSIRAELSTLQNNEQPRPTDPATPRPACTCQAGDPLCSCF